MSLSIEHSAHAAKEASKLIADMPGELRNAVLVDLAQRISTRTAEILHVNVTDMQAAAAAGVDAPRLRRLELTSEILKQMCDGLRQIAAAPDPVGQVTHWRQTPVGLTVQRVRTPLGAIAMIYEARPSVTIDAFALCFKAGNACILKGGKEANRSNQLLASIAKESLAAHGAPVDALTALTTIDREQLQQMLTLTDDIDLVIPRGGEALIRFVHEHSRIPTIQHFKGVCHVFVDKDANLEMALDIVATGKTSAPATCNATECVLIHAAVAENFIPMLVKRARDDGFSIRGDKQVVSKNEQADHVQSATGDDWGREFLDLILAAKVVDSMNEACEHIDRYSSDHTEAIVTDDTATADTFCKRVKSSCVLVNASTRFNDGFQLGLGAEIGISTSRIHAYGPMGLDALTIDRFVVRGSGHTR